MRREGEIDLDGRLDDPAWSRAAVLDGFVQQSPDWGAAPHQQTTARVLWDDEAIWIAFDCRDDAPGEIVSRLARRDQFPESDRVQVFLAGLGDGRSGFEFTVTVAGVLSDAILSGDTGNDRTWDGVWWAETARDPGGWTVEIRIPFRILRWRNGTTAWGLELGRIVSRTREYSAWQSISVSSGTFVSSFGRLEGIDAPSSQSQFEIRPYVAGRLGLSHAPDSLAPRDTVSGDVGGEMHWAPWSDLSIDMTLNPDFGQVELDPQVVNLSPYETFYPERRPFFVEGIDVFRTPFTLVHTRRIGGAPDTPEAPDDDPLAELPETTRILGAVKATGDVGTATSFGALAATTLAADATTESGRSIQAEPPASYYAARVRRQLSGTSTVGLIGTDVERWTGDGPRDRAYTGGADWDLRSPGAEWRAWGQMVGSWVDHPHQQPYSGWASDVRFGRVAGEGLRPEAGLEMIGPGFDPNDLGFSPRDDQMTANVGLAAVRDRPLGPLRDSRIGVAADAARNAAGENLGTGQSFSAFAVFRNSWSTSLSLGMSQPHVDDRESRGGPSVDRPGNRSIWVSFDTDFSKPVFGGGGSGLERRTGAPFFDQFAWITVRPADTVELGFDVDLRSHDGFDHWVATETDAAEVDHWVFASLALEQVTSTFRTLVVLSRTLTLQLYVQLLRAIGDHSRYRELVPSGALVAPAVPHADDQDFDTTGVSLQAVLRWEFRAGSPVFLVYRHWLSTDAVPEGATLADGTGPFFGHVLDRGDDVLMAKVTLLYWP